MVLDIVELFTSWHINIRFAITLGVIVILWIVFAKLLLKALSVIPLLIKRILIWLYLLIEIPIGALHHSLGEVFGSIDEKLASFSDKATSFLEEMQNKMVNPNTIGAKKVCTVYIIILAYLIISMWANLSGKPFTFWREKYLVYETKVIDFIDSSGWIE